MSMLKVALLALAAILAAAGGLIAFAIRPTNAPKLQPAAVQVAADEPQMNRPAFPDVVLPDVKIGPLQIAGVLSATFQNSACPDFNGVYPLMFGKWQVCKQWYGAYGPAPSVAAWAYESPLFNLYLTQELSGQWRVYLYLNRNTPFPAGMQGTVTSNPFSFSASTVPPVSNTGCCPNQPGMQETITISVR